MRDKIIAFRIVLVFLFSANSRGGGDDSVIRTDFFGTFEFFFKTNEILFIKDDEDEKLNTLAKCTFER